jgi:Secretion system C-terminal sorting domain
MSKKIQLNIASPCHENWDAMTPVQQGKFCGSCQKQVVDFSAMSDRQIAEFFKKPSTGSVCGRFMTDQLDRAIEIPRKRIPWVKYLFTIALPALFFSKVSAQKTMGRVKKMPEKEPKRIPVDIELRTVGMVAMVDDIVPVDTATNSSMPKKTTDKITGRVVDQNGQPVSFASIEGSNAAERVMANEQGVFIITKNWLAKGKSIHISSAGYENKIIVAGGEEYKAGELLVELKANVVLEEVVINTFAQGTIRCTRMVGMVSIVKGDTIVSIADTTAAIADTENKLPMEDNKLRVYPNPAKAGTSINLSFKQLEEGYYQFHIISVSGQLIQQKEIWIDAEARLLNVDIPFVTAGNYFMVLTNKKNGKKYSEKIIVL